MNNYTCIFFLALLITTTKAVSAEAEPTTSSYLNPTVISSSNGSGPTVGVEYKFNGDLLSKSFESQDDGFDPNAIIGSTAISYFARGTVAASKDRNPKNFLEFMLDAKLKYSAPAAGTITGGLFSKYETNQSFSDKQFVYGLGATYGKYAALGSNDFIAVDVAYGRVNPKDDSERKAAIGSATLDSYYRLNLELLIMYPLQADNVSSVEFNFRYFVENNAPAAIRSTGLDEHQLGTILLNLKNDLYVAYSAGKLPFDRKNDQIFQIGYSYKFK